MQLRLHNKKGASQTSQTNSVPKVAFNHTVRGTSPKSALQQLLNTENDLSNVHTAAPPSSEASVELSAIIDRELGQVPRSNMQAVSTTSLSDSLAAWQLQADQADSNR